MLYNYNLVDLSFSSTLTIFSILIFDIGFRLFAIWHVPNNRKPSDAMAWMLVIFFLPIVGALIFLLLGHSTLSKKRRSQQNKITTLIYKNAVHSDFVSSYSDPIWLNSIERMAYTLTSIPMTKRNSAEIMSDYKNSIDQMVRDVESAKEYVHVEFYVLSLDKTTKKFFDALSRAKKRGVVVRVLMDHIGSLQYPNYKKTVDFLESNEIPYRLMLPLQPLKRKFQRPDLRNHRKLLIVDGSVGFMGSQNIIESTYSKKSNLSLGRHWVDLMLRLEGPVVNVLDSVFVGDWFAETDELLGTQISPIGRNKPIEGDLNCQLIPSGPGFEEVNNLKVFTSLIYASQERLVISSPYFVPDESMLIALTTASQRGVEVELFVSESGDQFFAYHAQRSYYESLLKAGIKIFLYKSPHVLHAKHFSVDDSVSVVGSSNMDMRSFNLNMEVSLLVHSKEFTSKLRVVESSYRDKSRQLTLNEWQKRPIRHKLIDNIARLTSSLQ